MKTQSQIFDFGRFGDCLMRDLRLNGKSWMLKALVMLGVTSLLLLLAASPNMNYNASGYNYRLVQEEGCFLIFRFCGSVFCALGASMLMENMTTNGQRLNSLMSPISDLEKYLSRFLVCIVGVTLAFLVCFAIADAIRVLYIRANYGELTGLSYLGPFGVQAFAESEFYLWGFLLAAQATFALGSTIWPKNAFLKTFGTIIVLLIVFWILSNFVYTAFHKPGLNTPTAPDWIENAAKIVPGVWAVFCYITAYFRFKESEIINRF